MLTKSFKKLIFIVALMPTCVSAQTAITLSTASSSPVTGNIYGAGNTIVCTTDELIAVRAELLPDNAPRTKISAPQTALYGTGLSGRLPRAVNCPTGSISISRKYIAQVDGNDYECNHTSFRQISTNTTGTAIIRNTSGEEERRVSLQETGTYLITVDDTPLGSPVRITQDNPAQIRSETLCYTAPTSP